MTNAEASAAFAALGDPTRLAIVSRLSDGESRSITALSSDFELTRQAVTKHLKVLERAGLVSATRVGRESRFAYESGRIDSAREFLDMVSHQWDEALKRLRDFVEEPE